MDVNDVLETANAFSQAAIIPVHCEGWAHFSQTPKTSFSPSNIAARVSITANPAGRITFCGYRKIKLPSFAPEFAAIHSFNIPRGCMA